MFFSEVNEGQPDAIFGLLGAFAADVRKEKVNLMVGVYKDDQLKTELMSAVQKAKEQLVRRDMMADYLPIDGLSELIELLGPLVFGEAWEEAHGRIYAAHTPGGTAALRVGAEFLVQEVTRSVCVPNHTWPVHRMILERAGAKVENYPYYSREKKGFDAEATLDFLAKLPEKTAVVLHACCHNPTGCDPTIAQWREISRAMKEKKLLPFFDIAYQGLGEGEEKDVESIRLFMRDGHEMLIAYSCSKTFSLYCQRVGTLFIVDENAAVKLRVGSQIKRIIRAMYSNPPAHGARVVAEVLGNKELRKIWQKDLEAIRSRISGMREMLIQRLSKAKRIHFDYLRKHKGMFSFTDLNKSQVQKMIDQFAIYMTDNGRISISGLTTQNVDYVANSLLSVCGE